MLAPVRDQLNADLTALRGNKTATALKSFFSSAKVRTREGVQRNASCESQLEGLARRDRKCLA